MIPNRILVVDDEAEICRLVGEVAEDLGLDVATASNHEEAERLYRTFKPDRIVLDLSMPGRDGVEFLRFLAAERCPATVLLLSGFDARVVATAERLGRNLGLRMGPSLGKPIPLEKLETALRDAGCEQAEISPAELTLALQEGNLDLHWQPKVMLPSKEICGAEALLRWTTPRHGSIPPSRFVPLFEQHNLAVALTEYVLRAAANQLHAWGCDGIEVSAALNLSAAALDDRDLPDRCVAYLREKSIAPSTITFEVTETAAMEDTVRASEILARLRLKGFHLSIDDFGTGYSSLVWLHRMPFSELKIDRLFISELETNADAPILVRTIVELAHNLGLSVCAEGVETESVCEHLVRLGCDVAQGYLFSRPLPANEFVDRLG